MKDEVLDKALPSDATVIPRYDVIDANGNVVVTNAQLKLKNPVLQEGTPLDKTTLLKDTTAQILGLPDTATPDDAMEVTAKRSGKVFNQYGQLNLLNAKKTSEKIVFGTDQLSAQIAMAFDPTYGCVTKSGIYIHARPSSDNSTSLPIFVYNINNNAVISSEYIDIGHTNVRATSGFLPSGDVLIAHSWGHIIFSATTGAKLSSVTYASQINYSEYSTITILPIDTERYIVYGIRYVSSSQSRLFTIFLVVNGQVRQPAYSQGAVIPYDTHNRWLSIIIDTNTIGVVYGTNTYKVEYGIFSIGTPLDSNGVTLVRKSAQFGSISSPDSSRDISIQSITYGRYIYVLHYVGNNNTSSSTSVSISLTRVDIQTAEIITNSSMIDYVLDRQRQCEASLFVHNKCIYTTYYVSSSPSSGLLYIFDPKTLEILSQSTSFLGVPVSYLCTMNASPIYGTVLMHNNGVTTPQLFSLDTQSSLMAASVYFNLRDTIATYAQLRYNLIIGTTAIKFFSPPSSQMGLNVYNLRSEPIQSALAPLDIFPWLNEVSN